MSSYVFLTHLANWTPDCCRLAHQNPLSSTEIGAAWPDSSFACSSDCRAPRRSWRVLTSLLSRWAAGRVCLSILGFTVKWLLHISCSLGPPLSAASAARSGQPFHKRVSESDSAIYLFSALFPALRVKSKPQTAQFCLTLSWKVGLCWSFSSQMPSFCWLREVTITLLPLFGHLKWSFQCPYAQIFPSHSGSRLNQTYYH